MRRQDSCSNQGRCNLHIQLAHLNFLKAQAATFSRLSRASSSAKTGIMKRIVRLSWYSPL